MRPKKYNLVPEKQLKMPSNSSGFSVTVTAGNVIYITKFDVDMFDLDGKTIRIYADIENKTLAWKEVREGSNLSALEGVRVLGVQTAGNIVIPVGKILKQMGVLPDMLPFKNVPVTEYNDQMEKEKYKIIDLRDYIKKP